VSRRIVSTCYLVLDPRVGAYFMPVFGPIAIPEEWGVFVDGQCITKVVVNGPAVDVDIRHPKPEEP
jgi:hypothetical protein